MGLSRKVDRSDSIAVSAKFNAEADRRAASAWLTQIGREVDVRPDQVRVWLRVLREAIGTETPATAETLEAEEPGL